MNRKKPSSTSGFSTSSSIVISYTCILWFQWGLKHSLSSYSLGMMVECELVDNLSLLFSCPIVSNFLWPHEMQHTRLPCPSLSPGICSNSCPLNQRCHPTISSSIAPFSSCPRSFPPSGSFPVSWLFISASKSVLPIVKNLPAMQETRVPSLGWEDPLEKGMATHSNILD